MSPNSDIYYNASAVFGLAALRPLTQLTAIAIQGCQSLGTREDCDAVASMTQLRSLTVIAPGPPRAPPGGTPHPHATAALLAMSTVTSLEVKVEAREFDCALARGLAAAAAEPRAVIPLGERGGGRALGCRADGSAEPNDGPDGGQGCRWHFRFLESMADGEGDGDEDHEGVRTGIVRTLSAAAAELGVPLRLYDGYGTSLRWLS